MTTYKKFYNISICAPLFIVEVSDLLKKQHKKCIKYLIQSRIDFYRDEKICGKSKGIFQMEVKYAKAQKKLFTVSGQITFYLAINYHQNERIGLVILI
jgi:hypothetical protein